MMPRTAEAFRQSLATWLPQCFPNEAAPAILSASPITDGWETEIWSVTMGRGSATEGVIIRIYAAGAVHKAEYEHKMLQGLARGGYPVPRVLALEIDPAYVGAPFLAMERIEGPTLGEQMLKSQDHGPNLDLFLRLMVDLHRVPYTVLPELKVRDPQTLAQQIISEAFDTVGRMGQTESFAPILQWLDARCRGITCPQLAVIHYDFHPMNILMRDGTEPVVIDWSGGEIGDPRTDLAWTMVVLGSMFDPAMPDVLHARYEAISGEPLHNMDFFEAFALTRRLFHLVITLTAGAEKMGMLPETADRIRQNPGQLRYLHDRLVTITGVALPGIAALLAEIGA